MARRPPRPDRTAWLAVAAAATEAMATWGKAVVSVGAWCGAALTAHASTKGAIVATANAGLRVIPITRRPSVTGSSWLNREMPHSVCGSAHHSRPFGSCAQAVACHLSHTAAGWGWMRCRGLGSCAGPACHPGRVCCRCLQGRQDGLLGIFGQQVQVLPNPGLARPAALRSGCGTVNALSLPRSPGYTALTPHREAAFCRAASLVRRPQI